MTQETLHRSIGRPVRLMSLNTLGTGNSGEINYDCLSKATLFGELKTCDQTISDGKKTGMGIPVLKTLTSIHEKTDLNSFLNRRTAYETVSDFFNPEDDSTDDENLRKPSITPKPTSGDLTSLHPVWPIPKPAFNPPQKTQERSLGQILLAKLKSQDNKLAQNPQNVPKQQHAKNPLQNPSIEIKNPSIYPKNQNFPKELKNLQKETPIEVHEVLKSAFKEFGTSFVDELIRASGVQANEGESSGFGDSLMRKSGCSEIYSISQRGRGEMMTKSENWAGKKGGEAKGKQELMLS
jgi:hypothetical protein